LVVLLEVQLGLLIEGEVDQRMRDAHHGGREALEQCLDSFLLLYFEHGAEDAFVDSFVVFLPFASEDLCLHPGPHHPERVCDDVTHHPTAPGRQGIQLVGVFVPPVPDLQILFLLFIQRKVKRVEQRNAKHRD